MVVQVTRHDQGGGYQWAMRVRTRSPALSTLDRRSDHREIKRRSADLSAERLFVCPPPIVLQRKSILRRESILRGAVRFQNQGTKICAEGVFALEIDGSVSDNGLPRITVVPILLGRGDQTAAGVYHRPLGRSSRCATCTLTRAGRCTSLLSSASATTWRRGSACSVSSSTSPRDMSPKLRRAEDGP